MDLLYKFLLPFLLYAQVGANGIVEQVLEDGQEGVPTEYLGPGATYKQFLECSSEHTFIVTQITEENKKLFETRIPHHHTFFLQCFELEGSDIKVAVLYFNTVAVDRLVVTTCDKSEVEKSIFPPKLSTIMEKYYADVHVHKLDGVSPHFRFVMQDGKCYERLYRVELNKVTEEYRLIQRKQLNEQRNSDLHCGMVAFSCKAPSKDIKEVGAFGKSPEWAAYRLRGNPGFYGDPKDVTITRQIECLTFHPGPKTSDVFYELVCVEARQKSKVNYYAFVNHGGSSKFGMEKFTVSSCMEDDLMNAIFVVRDKNPRSMSGRLRFKRDGKCYERKYFEDDPTAEAAEKIECPSTIYDWVNPKRDSAIMWSFCYGPTSNAGEPKTLENS